MKQRGRTTHVTCEGTSWSGLDGYEESHLEIKWDWELTEALENYRL